MMKEDNNNNNINCKFACTAEYNEIVKAVVGTNDDDAFE